MNGLRPTLDTYYRHCLVSIPYDENLLMGGIVSPDGMQIIHARDCSVDELCELYCFGKMGISGFLNLTGESDDPDNIPDIPDSKLNKRELEVLSTWLLYEEGNCADFLCRRMGYDIFYPKTENGTPCMDVYTIYATTRVRLMHYFMQSNLGVYCIVQPLMNDNLLPVPNCGLTPEEQDSLARRNAAAGKIIGNNKGAKSRRHTR